jgi:hypothetical protein
MNEFESRVVVLGADESTAIEPLQRFSLQLSERDLEAQVVAHPELLGEELLVLGSQLAEFTEDRDRLDVLAVDRDGEIVLAELKVDEAFRLTDLQALAYAGAYSTSPPERLARTFARSLGSENGQASPVEEAKRRITEFVTDLEDFDQWEPSRQIRIKLVAPKFPARVLSTVKWLGDVYGMPIEAIQVQLFSEPASDRRILTFERLLPLKSAQDFDMTVRGEQKRIKVRNVERRPEILRVLLEAGELKEGDELWYLTRSWETLSEIKDSVPDDDPRLRVVLALVDGKPRFRWTDHSGAEELLSPSAAWRSIAQSIHPDMPMPARKYRSVYPRYSRSPGGESLGDWAESLGIWELADETE